MTARLLILSLLAIAAICRSTSAAEYRTGQRVMGTVLQVTVIADDPIAARKWADQCVEVARHWDDVLTTWRTEGELARLNANAGKGAIRISGDLRAALRSMLLLADATGGAFDPAVGSLVERWRTPHATVIAAPSPRLRDTLRLDADGAVLATSVSLDAGAIGKGIALDEIARMLRATGVRAAFLDFGGSGLYGFGVPPGNTEGWTVALAGLEPGEIHGTIALRDASLSTSRSSGPGDPAGPIVDPRTGRPVVSARLATVLSPDATAADAWSTALVVGGRRMIEQAAKLGVLGLIQDESGTVSAPGLAEKIRRVGHQDT